jgi:hypothetical protein
VTSSVSAWDGDPKPPPDNEQGWREATRLRAARRAWIVIWLAPERRFRAYARMPGAKRDTALSATTSAEMASLIGQAEKQAAQTASSRKKRL